ncbi:MAG: efflux RND transporter periplasmic adaptor subunit [Burkholderiales bacterium]
MTHVLLPLLILLAVTACGDREAAKPAVEAKTAAAREAAINRAEGEHSDHEEEEGDAIKLSQEEQRAAGIEVARVEPRAISERLVLTAVIQPNLDRLAHVAPRVAGRIVRVMAKLGDSVRAGETLALLDSVELGEARSVYAQTASEHAMAKANFERVEKLHAEQIVPEKEFLRVRSEYEKSRAALRAADDKLRLLGVAPAKQATTGSPSVFPLNAPFAGTVIEKDAVLGELAQPDKSIFTVADLSVLWIDGDLYEKDLAKVKIGSPAEVTVAAYPGTVFKGRLVYVSAMVEKETRTLTARIEVSNTDGRLRPEMFASVAIETPATSKVLAVPEDAVVLMDSSPIVFVQEHGGFEPRPVTVGDKLRGLVVVTDGLEPGTPVVIAGAYALKARLQKAQLGAGHAH